MSCKFWGLTIVISLSLSCKPKAEQPYNSSVKGQTAETEAKSKGILLYQQKNGMNFCLRGFTSNSDPNKKVGMRYCNFETENDDMPRKNTSFIWYLESPDGTKQYSREELQGKEEVYLVLRPNSTSKLCLNARQSLDIWITLGSCMAGDSTWRIEKDGTNVYFASKHRTNLKRQLCLDAWDAQDYDDKEKNYYKMEVTGCSNKKKVSQNHVFSMIGADPGAATNIGSITDGFLVVRNEGSGDQSCMTAYPSEERVKMESCGDLATAVNDTSKVWYLENDLLKVQTDSIEKCIHFGEGWYKVGFGSALWLKDCKDSKDWKQKIRIEPVAENLNMIVASGKTGIAGGQKCVEDKGTGKKMKYANCDSSKPEWKTQHFTMPTVKSIKEPDSDKNDTIYEAKENIEKNTEKENVGKTPPADGKCSNVADSAYKITNDKATDLNGEPRKNGAYSYLSDDRIVCKFTETGKSIWIDKNFTIDKQIAEAKIVCIPDDVVCKGSGKPEVGKTYWFFRPSWNGGNWSK